MFFYLRLVNERFTFRGHFDHTTEKDCHYRRRRRRVGELATSLGHKLGRRKRAMITLVDRNHSHLWKPLLHEVATGSLDEGVDALSYMAHARNHAFVFQLGSMSDIDREQ